jgi:hypothetical protein
MPGLDADSSARAFGDVSFDTSRSAMSRYNQAVEQVHGLFPDGYCDCRCGPAHHQVRLVEDFEDRSVRLRSFCRYHDRACSDEKLPDLTREEFAYVRHRVRELRCL